jgi:hypothetical protein
MDCANANCNCSWSLSFIPVAGWKAIPTKIDNITERIKSYMVIECPLFVPDRPCHFGYRITKSQLSKLLGISERRVDYNNLYAMNKHVRKISPDLVICYEKDITEDKGYYFIKYRKKPV